MENLQEVNTQELVNENQRLLNELEQAYRNMENILKESQREKEIAYQELQEKLEAMESLYAELSKKENMLIHMEKMSSIGQFISELIHEISSPLTAITLQVELGSISNPAPETKQRFDQILSQAKRIHNLLNRFRGMIYKGQEDFRVFDLTQNLNECVRTIEIIKPKEMKIITSFSEDSLPVLGDPYQVDQVFLNLAKNAFDAMKNNGTYLAFTSRKVTAGWIKESGEVGKHYCQKETIWEKLLSKYPEFCFIEVKDEGQGIPPDIIKDIFAAFFTTKERGKGTGLGLSISSDIVMRHEGNLAVKSDPGKGTTFQVLLPVHNG